MDLKEEIERIRSNPIRDSGIRSDRQEYQVHRSMQSFHFFEGPGIPIVEPSAIPNQKASIAYITAGSWTQRHRRTWDVLTVWNPIYPPALAVAEPFRLQQSIPSLHRLHVLPVRQGPPCLVMDF